MLPVLFTITLRPAWGLWAWIAASLAVGAWQWRSARAAGEKPDAIAMLGKGEASQFRGISGKRTMLLALIKGDLQAMMLLPKMFGKRRRIERLRKLSPGEVRRLLLKYRIPLKDLSRQAN